MRSALSIALATAIAICGIPVQADTTTTFASLTVNGTEISDVLVALDAPGVALEIEAAKKDVPDLGTIAPEAELTIEGNTYVKLDALAPRVRYTWDDQTVKLDLVVTRAGRQDIDIAPNRSAHDLSATHGAYVNYDVLKTSNFGVRGTIDGNATIGAGFAHISASASPRVAVNNAYFERDDPIHGRRYQAGATETVGDSLFTAASLIGFTTRHDDGVAPFSMNQARPMFSGIADAPSIADVYVNGHLVRSVPVAPGAYSLANIPADSQTGNVNVVLRDANGNVRRYDAPYSINATLLRAGATEDSAAFGRTDDGTMLFDGSYRRGISNRATVGVHVGAAGHSFAASAGADLMLMPVTAHLSVAAVNGRPAGFDASVSVPMRGGSLGVDVMQRSPELAAMSGFSSLGEQTRRLSVELAQRISAAVDVFASVGGATFTTTGRSRTTQAGVRVRLAAASFASLFVQNERGDGFSPHTGIAMSFTTSLGHGRSLSASSAAGSAGVEVQQAPKGPLGFSYDARTGLDTQHLMTMEQTTHGTFSASVDRTGSQVTTNVDASGGIAFAGGKVGFTAPIYEAFALVSVPGVANAPIYVDQQLAGRTDAHGNLFVNSLRRYSNSRISVGYDDLPIDVELEKPVIEVTPKSRGGAVALFKVHRVRSIAGTIVDESGNPPPAYARMTVESERGHVETRLDETGNFTIDDLTPAFYRFSVKIDNRACLGTLRIPADQKVRIDLGRVNCSSKVAQR